MDDEDCAREEVKSNKCPKKYSIAISKPPGAYSEVKTIFLCALPDTVTDEKIKNLFMDW